MQNIFLIENTIIVNIELALLKFLIIIIQKKKLIFLLKKF
jgi:hypothetical protein